MKSAIVFDQSYAEHDTGPGHPESPQRIQAIGAALKEYSNSSVAWICPRRATIEELGYVHEAAYVEEVASTSGRFGISFDPDTRVGPKSFDVARLAVGGVIVLADAIAAGEVDNGFALVRPPGHHAERGRAMGFCLFNNVAIAAEHLRRVRGFRRILIVDWDLHHGNGTQHAFYSDPAVLYFSLHQFPYYPGSGAAGELGSGDGSGFTVNVPLPAGCGDDEYLDAFARVLSPVSSQFRPDFVLVSCGFDCHARDPLGGMEVSTEAFVRMTRMVKSIAQEHANGRLALVLEGGYDLTTLRDAVPPVLDELSADPYSEPPCITRPRSDVTKETIEKLSSYWKF